MNAHHAGEPDNILVIEDLEVTYRPRGRAPVRAVDKVSLQLRRGETLGLVGESGSGKSSIGKSLVLLPPPTSGRVILDGSDLTRLGRSALRSWRRRIQMIFQDPISSLNPRRTAVEIVAEPLRAAKVSAAEAKSRALAALDEVGVNGVMAQRRPHELSGGQCQRVSIARAIVQQPQVLICDEPVSALDVSVQAKVLNLLEDMKAEHDLSMVFISHDLAVVSNVSDRVVVLYLGRLCEVAPAQALYATPRHHYTHLLLSSVPDPQREREPLLRDNTPRSRPEALGCPFAPRCPAATSTCRDIVPEYREIEPDHWVACHHPIGGDDATPEAVSQETVAGAVR